MMQLNVIEVIEVAIGIVAVLILIWLLDSERRMH